MQNYPVRASHRTNLTGEALARLLGVHFGPVRTAGDRASTEYGALTRLEVHGNGKELVVDVTMNPKVPEEVARETIARYNRFLEEATGYSAKERARRLRKSARGSGD